MGHARCLNVRCHHVTVSQPTGGNSPSIQGSLRPVSGSWAWRRGRLLPEGGRTGRDASAIGMGDTTYHAMVFTEGDIDNDGRFEPLAADMKPYGSGADIDAACAPVLPPDAGRRTPTTRDGPDIRQCPPGAGRGRRVPQPRGRGRGRRHRLEGWNWSAQFGGLGYDGDLDLFTVNGMVGEAFGYLLGAELLLTGWPSATQPPDHPQSHPHHHHRHRAVRERPVGRPGEAAGRQDNRRSVRFHRPRTSSGPTVAQLHDLSSFLKCTPKSAFILAPPLGASLKAGGGVLVMFLQCHGEAIARAAKRLRTDLMVSSRAWRTGFTTCREREIEYWVQLTRGGRAQRNFHGCDVGIERLDVDGGDAVAKCVRCLRVFDRKEVALALILFIIAGEYVAYLVEEHFELGFVGCHLGR